MCDTVAVGVNDCEEVGSGGLDERFIADGIVCFASKSAGASLLPAIYSVFELHVFLHIEENER